MISYVPTVHKDVWITKLGYHVVGYVCLASQMYIYICIYNKHIYYTSISITQKKPLVYLFTSFHFTCFVIDSLFLCKCKHIVCFCTFRQRDVSNKSRPLVPSHSVSNRTLQDAPLSFWARCITAWAVQVWSGRDEEVDTVVALVEFLSK